MPERERQEYEKLQQMVAYCHTETCLQQYILHYFGDTAAKRCGRCSNCTRTGNKINRTKEAQMVFSCIKRMREKFGKTMIAQVLTGSTNQKVKQFGFERLPTYGIMTNWTSKRVAGFIDYLSAEQYLKPTGSAYPTLQLTQKAIDVLTGEVEVFQYESVVEEPTEQDDVFEALRRLRKELSERERVPPYLIFSDKTLKQMSQYIPQTKKELARISGVGERKLEDYGEAFLAVLSEFQERQPEGNSVRQSPERATRQSSKNSHLQSVRLFQDGLATAEIASQRQLSEQTVVKHLIQAKQEGHELDLRTEVDPKKIKAIEALAAEMGAERLRLLKEALPEEISYQDIRFVLER